MTEALCAPVNNPPIDLTEVDEQSPPEELEAARSVCLACPLLVSCRRYALRTMNVAGVAGALTQTERDQWRTQNNVTVNDVRLIDVTPAQELTPDITDDLPVLDGQVPNEVRDLVLRMTQAHMSAEDIVTALHHPAVTHRTVKYIRHRYAKGATRVDT